MNLNELNWCGHNACIRSHVTAHRDPDYNKTTVAGLGIRPHRMRIRNNNTGLRMLFKLNQHLVEKDKAHNLFDECLNFCLFYFIPR